MTTSLPEPVASRVVALTADALGRLERDQVPAPLRRVAAFAPGRRAPLAGPRIAQALDSDEDFRGRVAELVSRGRPEVAAVLSSTGGPETADGPAPDAVDVAALAYLLGSEGWADLAGSAARSWEADQAASVERAASDRSQRLEQQLVAATDQLREVRARHREQRSELKAENTDLRHRLGDTRSRLRAAEDAATRATAALQRAETAAADQVAASRLETRRLLERVEELEGELATARRSVRLERDTGTLRARLLLDTLLETAQGLRRELALPAVEGAPADVVEADVAGRGTRAPSGHGSLRADDPTLLGELLALPRCHLVVDGYNVTKAAWPELSLERQRDRLLGGLAPLTARSGAEVTVVFDAGGTTERPLVNRPRGVRVLYSPPGVIADDVIRDLVAAEPAGRPVVVVSSDAEVVRDVLRAGARSVASAALSRLLAR